MTLGEVYIVLCRPEQERNIGSACRAMANNGITHLRIIGERKEYDSALVAVSAVHAEQIWEQAEFFDSITECARDVSLCAGTTRRRGQKRKNKLLLPEEFAASFCAASRTAIVFGNERTGLTDSELAECSLGITIPSHKACASLNLSHAVQIICYEIFRKNSPVSAGCEIITLERMSQTLDAITTSLSSIGFFVKTDKTLMHNFWRSVLSRASLSESEAAYIEYVFKKNQRLDSGCINIIRLAPCAVCKWII